MSTFDQLLVKYSAMVCATKSPGFVFCHLAACRADTELGAVGFDLFVQDVVSGNLPLQVCHGRAVLLRVHLFLNVKKHQRNTGHGVWREMTTRGQVYSTSRLLNSA